MSFILHFFFRENGLLGPVFNNYDIGGYLICYLFPEERIFIDNRPEAYPGTVAETYERSVSEEKQWRRTIGRYRLNCVFLNRGNDVAGFIERRKKDRVWAVVYEDDHTLIFLKRNRRNRALLSRSLLHDVPATSGF